MTNVAIQRTEELEKRLEEAKAMYGINFLIVTFDDWSKMILDRCLSSKMIDEDTLAKHWLKAYAYTLALKKREIAPIDEPCMEWVKLLISVLRS